jgi:hypothetical protein
MAKKVGIVCMLLLMAVGVFAERFVPEKADRYSMDLKGLKQFFYRYKVADHLYIPLKNVESLDLKFFTRNPNICFDAKVNLVLEDGIDVFGTPRRVYFEESFKEKADKFSKGDNIWVFGVVKLLSADEFELSVVNVYDMESDEEVFFRWKNDTKADNADDLIALGLKAIRQGKEKGNIEVWSKLGRRAIMEGLEIKKTKLSKPTEYTDLANQIITLLDDKAFALQVVIEAWKKNKKSPELNHYLRSVLRYSEYKSKWLPVAKAYEKEFWDRFKAVAYTEDDKMWELKKWVEINANKFEDAQEKIMLCAQRTYAMNPGRADAAAFVGKEVSDIGGFTSGNEIIVPRQPISVKADEGTLSFTIDNTWSQEGSTAEDIRVKYAADAEGDVTVVVGIVKGEGGNLETLNGNFIKEVETLKDFKIEENDIITINQQRFYRATYTFQQDGAVIKAEALLVRVSDEAPGLSLIFRAPRASFGDYSAELAKVRASLKYTE